MAISIKNEEADRLARELSALTGESLTEAITTALRERLQRQRSHDADAMRQRLERLQRRYAALPVLDDRTPEEIIGYDEHGVPA